MVSIEGVWGPPLDKSTNWQVHNTIESASMYPGHFIKTIGDSILFCLFVLFFSVLVFCCKRKVQKFVREK